MARTAQDDGQDKFRRYRATQKQRGMKLLRVWVPDPHAVGFLEEARRQAALLHCQPEERDALDFIERVADLGDA
jgi:hypothetical protein